MTFAITRRDFDPHSGPLISFCLPYVMIFRVHLFYSNKVSMDLDKKVRRMLYGKYTAKTENNKMPFHGLGGIRYKFR